MTYEEYLESQGYFYIPSGEDSRGGWATRTLNSDGNGYDTTFLQGEQEEGAQRDYQYALEQPISTRSGPVTSQRDLDYMIQAERNPNPLSDPRYAALYKRNTDYLSKTYGNIYDQPRTFELAPQPPPPPPEPAPPPPLAPPPPPPPRPNSLEEFMQQKASERGLEKTKVKK